MIQAITISATLCTICFLLGKEAFVAVLYGCTALFLSHRAYSSLKSREWVLAVAACGMLASLTVITWIAVDAASRGVVPAVWVMYPDGTFERLDERLPPDGGEE